MGRLGDFLQAKVSITQKSDLSWSLFTDGEDPLKYYWKGHRPDAWEWLENPSLHSLLQGIAERIYQQSIWLGPKGTRTPLHCDPYCNLLCQARQLLLLHSRSACSYATQFRFLRVPVDFCIGGSSASKIPLSMRPPPPTPHQKNIKHHPTNLDRRNWLFGTRAILNLANSLQIWGQKRVRIFSAAAKETLYPHQTPVLKNTSQIKQTDAVDPKLFPKFSSTTCQECSLAPGGLTGLPMLENQFHRVDSQIFYSILFHLIPTLVSFCSIRQGI